MKCKKCGSPRVVRRRFKCRAVNRCLDCALLYQREFRRQRHRSIARQPLLDNYVRYVLSKSLPQIAPTVWPSWMVALKAAELSAKRASRTNA